MESTNHYPGLARAGHNITLLEQSRSFSEIGAGIQLAPNATRILARFGVLESVLQHATLLECNSLRRYADDSELGSMPFMPALGHLYGAPALVIHRGDLQAILLRAAAWETGIIIRTNAKVVDIADGFEASIRLEDGECLTGHLVIAGDGLKSRTRAQIMRTIGAKNGSHHTGDAAYRILLPREVLLGDNEAMGLLNSKTATRWMGPGGHVMAYPVSNHLVFNMVSGRLPPFCPHEEDKLIRPLRRSLFIPSAHVWRVVPKKKIHGTTSFPKLQYLILIATGIPSLSD